MKIRNDYIDLKKKNILFFMGKSDSNGIIL